LALIGFSIFNMIILKFFKQGSDIGVLDNLFGLMFGAFRGAFVISLAFFLVSIVLPKTEYPEWLQKSFTLPYVEKGARTLARAAPKYLENISTLQKDLQQQAKEDGAIDDQYEPAYGKDTRRRMDRLIESTGHE